MKKYFLLYTLLATVLSLCSNTPAAEITVYGSQQFIRTTGAPNVFTDSFPSSIGEGTITILNGAQTGENRVSSAHVLLNGSKIFGPNRFNKKTYRMEAPVMLGETNQIEVKLSSTPGSYLTIIITREIPLAITLTNPIEGEQVSSSQITVTGKIEAASQYVEVAVNKSHALVNGSFFLAPDIDLTPGENVIHAVAVDSYGNRAEATLTVIQAKNTDGWIESQVSNEGGFAPLESRLIITPHIQGTLNWNTAVLDHSGPGVPIIDQQCNTEYSLSFSEPGFYKRNENRVKSHLDLSPVIRVTF